jgi:hypothetical protein
MFKKDSIKRIIFGILLLVAATLAASSLFLLSAAPVLGSGIEKTANTHEVLLLPPDMTANCNPVEVTVFKNRLHIRCAADSKGIAFFAVSLADAPFSDHVLRLALEALGSKKSLAIAYESDDFSGVKFGCLAKDCRAIQAITIR